MPDVFIVPPMTGEPSLFSTGTLSPVTMLSSTALTPFCTMPSAGTRSPGSTRTTSLRCSRCTSITSSARPDGAAPAPPLSADAALPAPAQQSPSPPQSPPAQPSADSSVCLPALATGTSFVPASPASSSEQQPSPQAPSSQHEPAGSAFVGGAAAAAPSSQHASTSPSAQQPLPQPPAVPSLAFAALEAASPPSSAPAAQQSSWQSSSSSSSHAPAAGAALGTSVAVGCCSCVSAARARVVRPFASSDIHRPPMTSVSSSALVSKNTSPPSHPVTMAATMETTVE
mmetsp:Transcript_23212/g.80867  ORF Transcript_23212/g.80867 Transcript_23212/m.80867 type:complete len:285 (-) Transcript_23212:952-1806(-)